MDRHLRAIETRKDLVMRGLQARGVAADILQFAEEFCAIVLERGERPSPIVALGLGGIELIESVRKAFQCGVEAFMQGRSRAGRGLKKASLRTLPWNNRFANWLRLKGLTKASG